MRCKRPFLHTGDCPFASLVLPCPINHAGIAQRSDLLLSMHLFTLLAHLQIHHTARHNALRIHLCFPLPHKGVVTHGRPMSLWALFGTKTDARHQTFLTSSSMAQGVDGREIMATQWETGLYFTPPPGVNTPLSAGAPLMNQLRRVLLLEAVFRPIKTFRHVSSDNKSELSLNFSLLGYLLEDWNVH